MSILHRMTKYEFARVVGTRANQISHGDKPKIKPTKTEALEIAQEELKAGKCPIIIVRHLPRSKSYEVRCRDLEIPNEYYTIV